MTKWKKVGSETLTGPDKTADWNLIHAILEGQSFGEYAGFTGVSKQAVSDRFYLTVVKALPSFEKFAIDKDLDGLRGIWKRMKW